MTSKELRLLLCTGAVQVTVLCICSIAMDTNRLITSEKDGQVGKAMPFLTSNSSRHVIQEAWNLSVAGGFAGKDSEWSISLRPHTCTHT